jgi:hypothetical protein
MFASKPLLDEAIHAQLPRLYATEMQGEEAIVQVKFFTPDSNWTWYVTEFDGRDIFFGLVCGIEAELGYFSLSELTEVRGSQGLPVERDLYFVPATLREIRERHRQERGE